MKRNKKKQKLCSICLEKIYKPAHLNLNCKCRYDVHYNCYMKWWRENKNCIICHERAKKPISWNKWKQEKKNKKLKVLKNKIKIKQTIESRHLVINPRNSIEPYINYINNLPYDNENEIKTITIGFILIIILIYSYYTLLHVE